MNKFIELSIKGEHQKKFFRLLVSVEAISWVSENNYIGFKPGSGFRSVYKFKEPYEEIIAQIDVN